MNNSAPVQEEEPEPDYGLTMELGEAGTVTSATVTTEEGAHTVEIYPAQAVDGVTVLEGSGDSTSAAAEKAEGSNTTTASDGQYPYQILEIPADGTEQFLRVEMTAQADYDKDVQLYVLNPVSSAWEHLDADRDGDAITALCPVEGYVSDGKVLVLVQARTGAYTPVTEADTFTTQVGDNADWDGSRKEGDTLADQIGAPDSYDFSIAWFSDTQYYSEEYQNHYANIVRWIVDNRDELDIQYVLHTGDIVDEHTEEYEWAFASQQQTILDEAGIPNGVLAGNHDVAFGNQEYDFYWKYFGAHRYDGNSWYGGSYKNNLGHYDIIEKDGVELLMLYISWDVYEEEAAWLNSVLAQYPDTPAIIATHCGINADGNQSYTSQYLLDNVCAKNENVLAILGGHYHGSSINTQTYENADGTTRTVYELCTDYQAGSEGGSGYLKMLYFDLANGKIYANSYSPSSDDVNYYNNNLYSESNNSVPMSSVDRAILPIAFERTEKSLTVSDIQVTAVGQELLGSAQVTGNSTSVRLNYMSGGDTVAALVKDDAGEIVAAAVPEAFVGGSFPRPTPTPAPTPTPDDGDQEEEQQLPFTDVSEDAWYSEAVRYVYEKGMMNGTGNTSFSPDAATTRGMIATILWRLEGEPQAESSLPFTDVKEDSWYGEAIRWAASEGIVNGVTGTRYDPDGTVTREQLTTMLCRYAAYKGCSVAEGSDLSGYRDAADVSGYAEDALSWAVSQGLVNGVGGNTLLPQGSATRAQIAAILMRLCENVLE